MGTTTRRSRVKNPDAWWQQAYLGMPNIVPTYEFEFEGEMVMPKMPIKFKNTRGVYKFRCLATNIETGKTWIDCINADTGEWKSFYIERFKGVVKPKRPRRRRKVV